MPSGSAVSRELADQAATNYPRGQRIVPDSGHYIHKDNPVAMISAINANIVAAQPTM